MSEKGKVILFGASTMGEAACALLKNNYDIVHFCDNDINKWRKSLDGIEIISPQNLKKNEFKDIEIIITSMYYKEISKQLESMGIEDYQVFNFKFKSKEEVEYCNESYKEFKHIIDNSCLNNEKQIKNLHIMQDNFYNKRFIEFVNENFPQDEHKFIIIKPIDYKLEYIDNVNKYDNVEILYLEYFESKLYYYVKSSQKVFIHYLYDYICEFICRYDIGQYAELNWIIWGGDLYEYLNLEIYDYDTKKVLQSNLSFRNYHNKYKSNTNEEYRKKAIGSIKYILPNGIDEDYDIVKANFLITAKKKSFIYPNPINFERLDDNYYNLDAKNIKEKYRYIIQLGNSGDPSNNHLEILKKLTKIDCKDFCVICPLSYGDKDYINYIIKSGKNILGDRFIALTEYMDEKNYYSFLSIIDIAIMNHNRQQALGNIFLLLYLGKKVFIKKEITTYTALKRLGLNIFDLKLFEDGEYDEIFYLDNKSKENNRRIIKNIHSNENIIEVLHKVFK